VADVWVVWAVFKRNLRTLARYPANTVGMAFVPLVQTLIPSLLLGSAFLVAGRAVGLARSTGSLDMAGFLFVGVFVSTVTFGIFWGTGLVAMNELNTGTLEATWLTPASRESLIIGAALSSLIASLIAGGLLLAAGWLIFGARYLISIAMAAPALALVVVGLVGLAYLVTAAVLVIKDVNFMIDTVSFLLMAGSGVLFPVTVLPSVLLALSLALPMTYMVDIARAEALGTRPLAPSMTIEYLALAGTGLAMLIVGRFAFRWAERRVRQTGSLGQY